MALQSLPPFDSSACNNTAYTEWHSTQLENTNHLPISLHQLRLDLLQVDRSQKEIWRAMNFDQEHDEFLSLYSGRRPKRLEISNGQVMEISTAWCKQEIYSLKESCAGGHGPPQSGGYLSTTDYHGDYLLTVHDTMCESYCLASDKLRSEAIAVSKCNCIELSTQQDEISYTREGDFCLKHSGYLLWDQIDNFSDICKDCELKNFTCARREYDSIKVPLKGYGNECNGVGMLGDGSMLLLVLLLL